MKKLFSFLLVIACLFSVTACGPHTHEFKLSASESVAATCTKDGKDVKVCECGEKEETVVPALGHDFKVLMETAPTCTTPGSTDSRCSKCGKMQYDTIVALGHDYATEPSEGSRVMRCLNGDCESCVWGESNGTHTEALTFSFTQADEEAFTAKYESVLETVNNADEYDASLHGYAETGALADEYALFDEMMTEFYDLVINVVSQRQLAEIAYYCDMDDDALEETYNYMKDYQTQAIADFYSLSRPIYDSCYREFYYYGMSEAEINAFLFDSDTVSNPEYTELKERNDAIESQVLALSNKQSGNELPMLYAEFVENNNAMAKLMGYDNYLDYAYENVYDREYTYQEVSKIADYVKTYLSPVFDTLYKKFNNISLDTDETKDQYYSQVKYSFFNNYKANTMVNDYIDLLAFDSNPDKLISFSDEFNKLMRDGNMFRGDYEGAFVTSISSIGLPIAYFGSGYASASTVVHEFGHFINEIYNGDLDGLNQSYDLLEMHSQGNELLYLCYLKNSGNLNNVALTAVETNVLVNMLYSVMAGLSIDTFEQAIYLNEYDGLNADVIMADGEITYDEYDLLYQSICEEFGAKTALHKYWRYGMTVTSPCYYVSYSVSALSVLQLYEMANTDGFDAAKDAYLKLFSYTDENPDMTMEEVLEYAGMISYNDEELYSLLNSYWVK